MGLKARLEQGISALRAEQKKMQKSLNTILARLPSHTSFAPPSYNPYIDPFKTPPPNMTKSPCQHDTTPPHKVPFFNIPSISIPNLELPKFDGDEKQCIAWINKAEEYFDIHSIPYDSEKIKYVAMQLEGNAYNWYMWWKTTTQVCSLSWNTFKNDFLNRFQGVTEKYFFAKITRLQQKGSVDEYTCEW